MQAKPISMLAKRVSSGITPLRSNLAFWEIGTVPWLKTEQLGEKYIFDTTEKITNEALEKTSIKLYPPNTHFPSQCMAKEKRAEMFQLLNPKWLLTRHVATLS